MAPNSDLPKQEALSSPSPFHAGEQRVQTLTGAREVSETLGELDRAVDQQIMLCTIALTEFENVAASHSDCSKPWPDDHDPIQ